MAAQDDSGRGFLGRVEFQVKSSAKKSPFVRLLVLLSAIFAVLGFALSPARAEGDGYAIRVQVKEQQRDAAGKTDNQPIAGVTVFVTDADGVEIGRLVTDADGIAIFDLPEKADYTVTIDESTLPVGQKLNVGAATSQTLLTDSFITKTKVVNFFTGGAQSVSQSLFEKIAQRLVDGVRLGLILAMCSVGLSLIFGTTGLTNFAHGEMVTFGGLAAFVLNISGLSFLGFLSFIPGIRPDGTFHILWAAPIGIIAGGAFGWALNFAIFGRLRKRGIGLVTQMVLTV